MRDLERFSALLLSLYDAAMAPERWRPALANVADALGGCAAIVQGSDRRTHTLAALLESGVAPEMVGDYERHYLSIDPRIAAGEALGPGVLLHDAGLLSEAEMDRHEYYADFLHRYDWRYFNGIVLETDGALQTSFNVQRSARQGPASDAQVAMFKLVAPHIERAVGLTVELAGLRAMSGVTQEALDQSANGLVVLDRVGRPLLVNRAARSIAAANDGVALSSHAIRFGGRVADRRIARLIAAASCTAEGAAGEGGGSAQIVRPSGRRPYRITVMPAPPAMAPWLRRLPAVLLTIVDPDGGAADPDRLRALYRLTPREAALAARLASGLSLKAAAAALDISERTARSHLAAIFLKTGTSRQAELVRLLLAVAG